MRYAALVFRFRVKRKYFNARQTVDSETRTSMSCNRRCTYSACLRQGLAFVSHCDAQAIGAFREGQKPMMGSWSRDIIQEKSGLPGPEKQAGETHLQVEQLRQTEFRRASCCYRTRRREAGSVEPFDNLSNAPARSARLTRDLRGRAASHVQSKYFQSALPA